MVKTLVLLLVLNFYSIFAYAVKEEEKYEKDVHVQKQECLKLIDASRAPGFTYRLHFYNTCASELKANICVEERDGQFKLYKTAVKVPKFGHYYINTGDPISPESIDWTSSIAEPAIPENCQK